MTGSVTDRKPIFARVLAGVDGSARAEEAARQAARIASAAGAELMLVYVIDTGHPHDRDVERDAEVALRAASMLAREVAVEPDARSPTGDPAEVLLAEAAEHRVDLVCLGPDAGVLGGAIRFGRVAARVVHEAPCSVLIGRPAGRSFPARITCGVDGSETSVATADLAAAIAASTGTELHLLHVVPVFRGRDAAWTLDRDEEGPPELEGSVDAVRARGVVPIRQMAMGRPEHALIAAVKRDGSDLLVVGHRGVTGVQRVLLGSVSEHCAKHAPCSVLVARR